MATRKITPLIRCVGNYIGRRRMFADDQVRNLAALYNQRGDKITDLERKLEVAEKCLKNIVYSPSFTPITMRQDAAETLALISLNSQPGE
jgi:hypothetical protein